MSGATDQTFAYDDAGQLSEAIIDGEIYQYSYGPRGEVTRITEPGRDWTLTYDAAARIDTITDADGGVGGAIYDAAGRLLELVEPNGDTTTYRYDARGLLVETVVTTTGGGGGGGDEPDPCEGLTPTIVGTEGDDVLVGTWGNDVIFGLGGNDTITGGSGNDIICGGPGNDTLHGESQPDTIHGGPGDDFITGADGDDTITGGAGNDTIHGDSQNDTIDGGAGDDQINGGDGDDTLDGGDGTDHLDGSWQIDTCDDAETHNSCETLTFDGTTAGGSGPGVPVACGGKLATIVGTPGDDTITGTWQDDVIVTYGGNDTIHAGSGNDTICAGAGDDVIYGESNADTISAGPGADTVFGSDGNDTIWGGDGDDTLIGDSELDTIYGGAGNDQIDGGPGDDVLDGGDGTDTVDGSWQNDLCDDAETPVSCESTTQSGSAGEPPAPDTTAPTEPGGGDPVTVTETRSYDPAGALIALTNTDGAATVRHDLLWDNRTTVPQIIQLASDDGTGSSTVDKITLGYQRELIAGASTSFSPLGDQLDDPADTWSPFGNPVVDGSGLDLRFGYRGELETLAGVYLRARVLQPAIAAFTDIDPLDGVVGSAVLANDYHYANNDPINLTDPLGLRPDDSDVAAPTFAYVETLLSACGEPVTRSMAAIAYGQCRDAWNLRQAEYAALDGSRIKVDLSYICKPDGGVGFFDVPPELQDAWAACIGFNGERARELLLDALGFGVRFAIGFIPLGDCALATYDAVANDRVDGWGWAGCLFDVATGIGIAKYTFGDDLTQGVVSVCRAYSSFSGDTEVVMADGSRKPISDIVPGDEVWATDPDTGESGPHRVDAVWPHRDVLVELDTSAGSVLTTEDHDVWNVTDQAWQETQHLDAGDLLLASNGTTVVVDGLDWSTRDYTDAWDLTVADVHTYHVVVGTTDILVHNCSGGRLTDLGDGTYRSSGGLFYGPDPNPSFASRVDHVLAHGADDVARPIHGVFTGDPLALTDEAWAIAQSGGAVAIEQGQRTSYFINMGRDVGYVGGQAGAASGNPGVRYIQIVVENGNDLVSSYPVSGIPTGG